MAHTAGISQWAGGRHSQLAPLMRGSVSVHPRRDAGVNTSAETNSHKAKSCSDPSSLSTFRHQPSMQSLTWQTGHPSARGGAQACQATPAQLATGHLALPESLTVRLCFTAGKRKKKEEQGKQDNANGNRNRKDTKDAKSGTKKRKSKQRGVTVPTMATSPAQ